MTDKPTLQVTITGPIGSGKTTLARALLELLHEADVQATMPEESLNPYDGDSIERLGRLRGTNVIIETSNVARSHVGDEQPLHAFGCDCNACEHFRAEHGS